MPHGATEDEVEGMVSALQLGGHVQHVLVARQRHGERVARHDAVQRELRALRLARHADLVGHTHVREDRRLIMIKRQHIVEDSGWARN